MAELGSQGNAAIWNLARLKAATAELEAALMKNRAVSPETILALAQTADLPDALRPRAAQEHGRVAGHVMTTALRGVSIHWSQLDGIARQVSKAGGPHDLSHDLLAYLLACSKIIETLKTTGLHRGDTGDFQRSSDVLVGIIDQVAKDYPDARSLNILRGGVASVSDRDAARRYYAEAIRLGEDGMATSIYDLGAHTYFSHDEVMANRSAEMVEAVSANVAPALAERPSSHDPQVNLLWSVDVGFLEIYGPYWFGLAPYLMRQGMGFVFAVVGEADRVAAVVEESRALIEQLARFHRLPDPSSYARAFTFVQVDLPPGVGQAKTFYACARMLVAERLLDAGDRPVLMLDADFTAHDPVEPYVRQLSAADLAVSTIRGLGVLWPWRRTIANVVWLKPCADSRKLLSHASDYITAGLGTTPSWTLDQNALSYAVEMMGDTPILNAQDVRRPFAQDKIRGPFEAVWRESQTA